MPIFLDAENKKVTFAFQKNFDGCWLHFYSIRGMPPHWAPALLDYINQPKGEYVEFEDLTVYIQNKIQPPTDQLMVWIKKALPEIASKEKFNYKNVVYGCRDYFGHSIIGCCECPKAVKIWSLKRVMCSHPGLKDKSFKWGFAEGRLTMVGFGDNEFPVWCPLAIKGVL